ncbi:iron-containing alcohol dehydrogenase [Enterococcus hulanensis]|uniref:Iron-containing alcohol dehydrogenase n=1 Tax=Enterococcus hulanensis TaxID=2559929 RepID=A0ABU3EUN2_9ENTE|nr:iron-containing alcohol dehydrogenase [Enterococcus hulanensis]MDT2598580.1 iron-containing alcohol dehydrogenase [Enterococcus hulanensis]MDT2607915.1 iron-containing alcohol dehydrogenase [Enterococcus hulanensis]MDT2615210.1 iron-containing alcohol dehydrogenase [Enterococcus hulanensis]MDT2626819.1 iron-containing alcohol dehydrogenase [Enterococcus hulanensis]MDT2654282.1 iron-containing alcohol dehydrogenase [Enterococcus hulanensis]
MKDFTFKVPQSIEFGMGSLKKLPEILKENQSEHVFLISDRGLEGLGVVKKIQDIIEAGGISCTTYLGTIPNPTVAVVNESAALYKECGATSIVALGGGSSMDVAKTTGVLAKYGGEITDYEGLYKVPGPIVPIIAIPTTAGSGSEVTASAVITDEARNYKMSVISYEMLPKYALLDPELIMTAPASIAASCGIDALIHAMEAYVSRNASPFTDAMAEKAMKLIGGNLRQFIANRQDEEAACAMMIGSTFAGMAFAWAKLGNVHAMSHPLSAYFHIAHGVANAILLPTIVEFNALADRGRYETIYNFIRERKEPAANFSPQLLIDEIKKLNTDLGIPSCLSEMGVTEDKIPEMAEDAMKSPNVAVNPRLTTIKDIIDLYQKAL